jgi:acyl carrier protein
VQNRVATDIRDYIVHTWLSGDARGFDDETDLQQGGILDSFSTLALIGFLDDTFKVQLEPADINAENFRTVTRLARLVIERLTAQGTDVAGP